MKFVAVLKWHCVISKQRIRRGGCDCRAQPHTLGLITDSEATLTCRNVFQIRGRSSRNYDAGQVLHTFLHHTSKCGMCMHGFVKNRMTARISECTQLQPYLPLTNEQIKLKLYTKLIHNTSYAPPSSPASIETLR